MLLSVAGSTTKARVLLALAPWLLFFKRVFDTLAPLYALLATQRYSIPREV